MLDRFAIRLPFLFLCATFFLASSACRVPNGDPRSEAVNASDEGPVNEPAANMADEATNAATPPPQPILWPIVIDDPDQWLHVEDVRDGADGAWATGSFDPKRNKLSIHMRDVREFAVDTSRVRINWDRIVILGLDGINSELRRRDFAVYHFQRNDHGQWVVLEP